MSRKTQTEVCGMAAGWLRQNFHIWSGVYRTPKKQRQRFRTGMDVDWAMLDGSFPTLVIDVTLDSWALPFAIHAGGPLLGKPGFHFHIGPINIRWSRL